MKRFLRKRRQGEKGQAMVEFMTVVVVIFFFLFLMLSLSILLVISDYIEYATFMAARTYKSGFSRPETQLRNAQFVFDKYFERVDGIARMSGPLQAGRIDPNNPQTDGLFANYTIDLFYLPPIFIVGGGGLSSRVGLTAEAHLGRDPTFSEVCDPDNPGSFFRNFLTNPALSGLSGLDEIAEQMDDNGC